MNTLTLKWGTLKSWDMQTPEAQELLQQYAAIGMSSGAMTQHDTPEQKELICKLIDVCDGDEIFLDWDGKFVPKDEAKKYVREYRAKP